MDRPTPVHRTRDGGLAAGAARELDLEWSIENDSAAAFNERVEARVELADQGHVDGHHEWCEPLGFTVCDADLDKIGVVTWIENDVASF